MANRRPSRTAQTSRAERERRNRDFFVWFMLPVIKRVAIEQYGLEPNSDELLSGCLSEIDTIKELRHLLGGPNDMPVAGWRAADGRLLPGPRRRG